MEYHCRDCSHTGSQRNAAGQCPACGSYDFRSLDRPGSEDTPVTSSNWKLVALVLLWAFLIYHIHQKLYS
jgi:predicted ATP-dependent serine protease